MLTARKRAERKWFRTRSQHADVLEGLEAAVRAHPAGSGLVAADTTRVSAFPASVTVLRRHDSSSIA